MSFKLYEGNWLSTKDNLRYLDEFQDVTSMNAFVDMYVNVRNPSSHYIRYVPHPVLTGYTVIDYGKHSSFLFIENTLLTELTQ